ncbi:MAG: glycosyltransferase [Agrococcus casei]|uniref:glycosyltransferase n=1 Tax=Agrococcus casei TaxID=343512 RepID=UPI003F9B8035
MSTTLRVILDDVAGPVRSGISWYSEEITRALVQTAPDGIDVAAFAAAMSKEREAETQRLLPGLVDLEQAVLPSREMREAWLHSLTTFSLSGLVHATSLFAPLRRRGDFMTGQTVVTVHAATPVSDRRAAKDRWFEKAIRRAWKHADGVVVPTYAVASQLSEMHDFGGRIRVIPGGVAPTIALHDGADDRAKLLGLPERFVVLVTASSSKATGEAVVQLLADDAMPDVPVVVVGPVAWDDATLSGMAVAAGLPPARYIPVGELDDSDLAVVLSRASALVHVSTNDCFGLPMLAAFTMGCPVVHVATDSLDEVADGAALGVSADADGTLTRPLAEGIRRMLDEPELGRDLAARASDRVRHFTWNNAAEQIWQFHADI